MNYWYVPSLSFVLVIIGLVVLLKSGRWIIALIEIWPWTFSKFEIKLMKIAWKIGGILLIGIGLYFFFRKY